MPNLEEDVAKLADKEGWITLTDFIKFALPTELCKVEFLDKYRKEEKEAKSSVKKERKKVRYLLVVLNKLLKIQTRVEFWHSYFKLHQTQA